MCGLYIRAQVRANPDQALANHLGLDSVNRPVLRPPTIFVKFVAAQKIKARGPFGCRLLNCMPKHQCARTARRQLRLEPAQVEISGLSVCETLQAGNEPARAAQAIKPQPAYLEHPPRRFAVECLQYGIGQHSAVALVHPSSSM